MQGVQLQSLLGIDSRIRASASALLPRPLAFPWYLPFLPPPLPFRILAILQTGVSQSTLCVSIESLFT
jgi:hypothetical protein